MKTFQIICLFWIANSFPVQTLGQIPQTLRARLESIYDSDQKYRALSDWKMIPKQDSLNQIEVRRILDQNGWLSEAEVGVKANKAIFLVIQHAELPVQEMYLPLMRDAVAHGKAKVTDLALLEDRVLMRQNRKQIYGSQVVKDRMGNWIVHPVEDPVHVDQRRSEIGLEPIAQYLLKLGVTWNLEEQISHQK